MANQSIRAAFERLWQHTTDTLSDYATKQYVDNKAAGGGALGDPYTQHCWLKEGYAFPEYGSIKTTLTSNRTLYDAYNDKDYDYYLEIAESISITDGKITLNNPRVIVLYTYNDEYDDRLIAVYSDTQGTLKKDDYLSTLVSHLNLRVDHDQPYIKCYRDGRESSAIIYHCTGINESGKESFCWSSEKRNDCICSVDQLYLRADRSSIVSYGRTGTNTDNVGLSELVYTTTDNAYQEGEDGAGVRYTYLGKPSDSLPYGGKADVHCWRKKGYAFEEYPTDPICNSVSRNVRLAHGYLMSQVSISLCDTVNVDRLTGKYIIPHYRYITFENYVGNRDYDTLYGLTYSDSETGKDGQDITKLPAIMRNYDYIIVGDVKNYKRGDSLILPSSWTIYRTKGDSNVISSDTGAYEPSSESTPGYEYDYIELIATDMLTRLSVGTPTLNTTHDKVNKLIYTADNAAYTPGDDGQGITYTYLGVPSSYQPLSPRAETGKYIGNGASAVVIITKFAVNIAFINGSVISKPTCTKRDDGFYNVTISSTYNSNNTLYNYILLGGIE